MVRALDAILSPPRAPEHHTPVPDEADVTGISLAGPLAPSVDAFILPGTLSEWSGQGPLRSINLREDGVDYQRHPAGDWDQWSSLPKRIAKEGYTHFWGAAFTLPYKRVEGCEYMATIHDLAVFSHPECFPARFAWYMRHQIRNTAKRADLIHVPTEFVARELERCTGFPRGRMMVAPLGVSPMFSPWPLNRLPARDPMLPADLRQDGRPYICAAGGRDPRKNGARLIQAFSLALETHPNIPHRLALMGGLPPGKLPASVCNRIIGLGRLNREQLRAVYRHADLLAFVSLTEGFGLPVLEAMACGCPVLASNTGSLPEVTGDAALTCDPMDVEGMARALSDLLTNPELRLAMRQAGINHASQFPWTRTVQGLAERLMPAPKTMA
jgi:alpha-1,3-rhamnosyl/mannosyltransferase